MKKLSKRNRRALIAIGAALALYLLVGQVALPFLERQQQIGDQIAVSERSLTIAQRMIQREPVYRAQLEQLESALQDYQAKLLDASDGAAAGGQIEEVVRSLAAQNGVRVTRSNPIPDKKIGENYLKISLQFNLESDLPSLIKFLHAVSVHPKFLLVEEFNLASFRVKNETRIQPRMQISGYIRLS